jgi:hypothetical protein
MTMNSKALLAAAGIAMFAASPAFAYEAGYPGFASPPGVLIGASAGVPPPGIYMFNQVFTQQFNLTGPATTNAPGGGLGNRVGVNVAVDVQGFLFVPGWTFLGATYDALIVQPFIMASVGSSQSALVNTTSQASGMHNTYFVPVELSWKLGGGFVVKTGVGIYAPDGTITNGSGSGANGLGNVGAPFWTFQPEILVSYLANGWNLTAAVYEEFNTKNSVDGYTTGNILHADFTATHSFGKWTIGPVASYTGQVTNDSCGSGCTVSSPFPGFLAPAFGGSIPGTAGQAQKYSIWSVGGLVEYNFGPASLQVWATFPVSSTSSNAATAAALGSSGDVSAVANGTTVFATLAYRLWAPEAPVAPVFHK